MLYVSLHVLQFKWKLNTTSAEYFIFLVFIAFQSQTNKLVLTIYKTMNGLVTELLTSWVTNRKCEQDGGTEAVDNGIQLLRESDIVLHYPILTWVLFPFCRPAKLFRSLLIPTFLNQTSLHTQKTMKRVY